MLLLLLLLLSHVDIVEGYPFGFILNTHNEEKEEKSTAKDGEDGNRGEGVFRIYKAHGQRKIFVCSNAGNIVTSTGNVLGTPNIV